MWGVSRTARTPASPAWGDHLTPEQREEFARDGIIRFPRVIAPADHLADGVWAHLAGRGIVRDDPATWPAGALHHLDGIHAPPELDRGYASVLDALWGAGCWK